MARADLGQHYRQSVLSQFDFPLLHRWHNGWVLESSSARCGH
jgi:hypothetical protein